MFGKCPENDEIEFAKTELQFKTVRMELEMSGKFDKYMSLLLNDGWKLHGCPITDVGCGIYITQCLTREVYID